MDIAADGDDARLVERDAAHLVAGEQLQFEALGRRERIDVVLERIEIGKGDRRIHRHDQDVAARMRGCCWATRSPSRSAARSGAAPCGPQRHDRVAEPACRRHRSPARSGRRPSPVPPSAPAMAIASPARVPVRRAGFAMRHVHLPVTIAAAAPAAPGSAADRRLVPALLRACLSLSTCRYSTKSGRPSAEAAAHRQRHRPAVLVVGGRQQLPRLRVPKASAAPSDPAPRSKWRVTMP